MTINGGFRLTQPATLHCDVLIIGSGAGGSSVAQALTAAGKDVLLLEEGPAIWAEEAPDSAANGIATLWRQGGMTVALGASPVAYAEGRCLGGGTEINSAIVQRTPDALLDNWASDYQIADFGAAALRPYYDQVFQTLNASVIAEPLGTPSEIFRAAAAAKGWRHIPLERAQAHCVGTNMCASACPTGAKQSMSSTLLRQALRQGLRLVADCRVRQIKRRGTRATGVVAHAQDERGRTHKVTIRCNTLFIAAGAVQTPALLRASGITANIGNSLRLHPTVKILAEFPFTLDAAQHRLPLYAVTEFMPDIRLGGSVFVPGFFGMALAEDWEQRGHLLAQMQQCGIYYAMVRAQGTGKVRPVAGNRLPPLVTYNLTPQDRDNLRRGLGALAELMFTAGAARLYPSLPRHAGWRDPAAAAQELQEARAIDGANLMTIHIFSSCPLGEDRTRCAANSYGKVFGQENIFIADASLLPEAPGVNPQATIMAIAARNAAAWLAGQ